MITIKAGVLKNALQLLQGIVTKSPLEHLQCVLVKNQDNKITFQATNFEASIISTINEFAGEIEGFCIDYQTFYEVINKYKTDDEVKITIEKGFALISKRRSSASIQVLEATKYPEILTMENKGQVVKFNKADLQNAISITKNHIFANETRYNINGLHFNFKQAKEIDVVSTTGHSLAKFTIEDLELNFDAKITIPRTVIGTITKLLENAEGDVLMNVSKNKIQIEYGNITFITKLIDAEFPDYDRVIPKYNTNSISVLKTDIFNAVDRASAILKNTIEPGITMNISNEVMCIKSKAGVNQKIEEIDCEADKPFIVSINANYLATCISALPSRKCLFLVEAPNSPILIKDAEDTRLLYVVMPFKI